MLIIFRSWKRLGLKIWGG